MLPDPVEFSAQSLLRWGQTLAGAFELPRQLPQGHGHPNATDGEDDDPGHRQADPQRHPRHIGDDSESAVTALTGRAGRGAGQGRRSPAGAGPLS